MTFPIFFALILGIILEVSILIVLITINPRPRHNPSTEEQEKEVTAHNGNFKTNSTGLCSTAN